MERKKLTEDEILQIVKTDLENARTAKAAIETKMVAWREAYEGKPDKEIPGRSNFVSKDVKKAIHWFIPNAIKPFVSTENIVEATPRSGDATSRAKSQSALLNYQFGNKFNRFNYIHQAMFIGATEGTVVARQGWLQDVETISENFEALTQEQLIALSQEVDSIEVEEEIPTENGMVYKGIYKKETIRDQRPTAEILKNEDFFILGDSIDSADACIQKIDTTLSELRKQDKAYNENGIYTNVDNLINTDGNEEQSSLESDRYTQKQEQGQDSTLKTEDQSRQKVTIYEYYGNIDIDGTGIAEPIVCVFSGNTVLKIGKNPFPDKEPPFVAAPFSKKAFMFWGDALTEFLVDVQNVKTAIMRTFVDLMANSTNGMKHVQKGSIDALNIRRLRAAKIGSVVEWKNLDGFYKDTKNEIPSDLLKMFELFTAEGENESGVTRYNQGLDAKSLNKTATGINMIMSQSQMRMWESSTLFAENFLKPQMRKWIAYNQEWLSESVAFRVAGDKFEQLNPDDIGGNYDLKINVTLAGGKEQKAQNIIQLIQQAAPLVQAGALKPVYIAKLFIKLVEIWDFKDMASELQAELEHMEAQQPQPQDGVPPGMTQQPQQM
ncbi:hypothetical protein [Sulfurimonas sp.]|uniref:portal protein n=1 Tax=Sulfurimonas sp. TaxID=2022749 RepID=UPI003568EAB3